MTNIDAILEQSITIGYDAKIIDTIISETYQVLVALKPTLSDEVSREYSDLQSEFSRIRRDWTPPIKPLNFTKQSLSPLLDWANTINKTYHDNGQDALYDPRTVIFNLKAFLGQYNGRFLNISRTIFALERHNATDFIHNHLSELDEEQAKQRIHNWHLSLPEGVQEICSEGDLADVAYLGSKAMADAFSSYFSQQCLSGALGDASLLPGGFSESFIEHTPYVNTFQSLIRISQKVMTRQLMKIAREKDLTVRDHEFWDYAIESIQYNKSQIDAKENISKSVKAQINLIHNSMIAYINDLYNIDISALKTSNEFSSYPKVSQLESVYMLQSKKRIDDENDGSGRGIFADEMGCGKTLEAILSDAIFRREGKVKKTLVVCPNQLKTVWKERFTKYLTDDAIEELYHSEDNKSPFFIVNGSASMKNILNSSVVIINYELLHRVADYKTDAAKEVLKNAKLIYENGIEELFKDDDILNKIHNKEKSINLKFSEIKYQIKGNKELSEWIAGDESKAKITLATINVLEEEKKSISHIFQYHADFLILDEAHAIKNPLAKRTNAIYELSKEIKNVALLTGTLIPNRYNDIDMPLRIVDLGYKSLDTGTFLAPKLRHIRQALLPYMSRNLRQDVSPRKYNVKFEDIEIKADKVMLAIYRAIIEESSLNFSEKGKLARLATINPIIAISKIEKLLGQYDHINPRLLDKIIDTAGDELSADYTPPKYKIVAEELRKHDGSAVIFTSHIEGNTRPLNGGKTLYEYLRQEFGAEKILLHDGQTSNNDNDNSNRVEVLKQFREGKDKKLVASYMTLSEGVDLTKATLALFVDLPYAIPEQAYKRLDRMGQVNDVILKHLTMADSRMSCGTKSGITIDEAVRLLGEDKLLISSIILDGGIIGEREMEAYKKLKESQGKDVHSYTPIKDSLGPDNSAEQKIQTENKTLNDFLNKTKSLKRSSERNVKDFDDIMKMTYMRHLLDPLGYTNKSNRAVAKLIISTIDLEDKLIADIGGGPASLVIAGNMKYRYDIIDAVDWKPILNQYTKENGLPMPDINFIQAYFENYLAPKPYDILSCNNVLHWTSTMSKKNEFSQRERFLRAANMNLNENGLLIIGMPGNYIKKAQQNLENAIIHCAFEIEKIGHMKSPDDNSFSELVTIARKIGVPGRDRMESSDLNFNFSAGKDKRTLGKRPAKKKSMTESKQAHTFVFENSRRNENDH